jgi:hypothetical protein
MSAFASSRHRCQIWRGSSVPRADSCSAAIRDGYSITLSARASSGSATARPSVLAVLWPRSLAQSSQRTLRLDGLAFGLSLEFQPKQGSGTGQWPKSASKDDQRRTWLRISSPTLDCANPVRGKRQSTSPTTSRDGLGREVTRRSWNSRVLRVTLTEIRRSAPQRAPRPTCEKLESCYVSPLWNSNSAALCLRRN